MGRRRGRRRRGGYYPSQTGIGGLVQVARRAGTPVQDPPTEDEEPKEAPVKPDEDARGIIGLWFEGNVRARAYRKMGRA